MEMETKEIVCECGYLVRGISTAHTKTNLDQHKKSKLHKVLMEARKK